jgi:hypothetical protein
MQLIDDIINTTGTENLSIMFTDMGNRNNLGIFTVNSTADVDANTINMTVTSTTAVGSISAGKVMGIRIGVGGGGGNISDVAYDATWNANLDGASKNALYDKIQTLVTLDTVQTITARKSFFTGDVADPVAAFIGHIRFGGTIPTFNDSSAGFGYDITSDTWFFQEQNGILNFGLFDFKSITTNRTYTLPDKSGTVALTSDLASTWSEAELTTYTTTGTGSETASTITVPADTLSTDGDILEFRYVLQTTGSTNSNTCTVNVNFASVGHGSGTPSSVTGTLSYVVKGSIQRITSTKFSIGITYTTGFYSSVQVFSDTIGAGNLGTTAYDLVLSIQDTAGNNNFKLVSGWVKHTAIG